MQGLAFWPGILQTVSARYTRGLGTLPGHAILEFLPQPTSIAATGTLTFTFDTVFINLFRCRVDFGSMRYSPQNGQTAVVKIWDRRWAWQAGGKITGRFNARHPDGTLDSTTEASPQQLASLLLNAMGETGYDVSALPNDARPYVDWSFSHPATELDRLCELLGCRVCLKIATDRVVIVRLGQGALLPDVDLQTVIQNVDLAETPDALEVVGDVARYQSKLKLQAVGKETDGTIRPIDNLSYKPSGGWVPETSFAAITDIEEKKLAQEWVFRKYQIVSQADGSQDIPDFGDVGSIQNIKPIDPYLVETYTDGEGRVRFQPAFVEGVWTEGDTQFNFNTTDPGTIYQGDFSIDREDGIVTFPVPVYQLGVASTAEEAELYLTCSYNAIDPATGTPIVYFNFRPLGGANGTGPKIIRRPDIRFTSRQLYDDNTIPVGTVNNKAQVDLEANAQLDATQLEFLPSQAFYAIYNGLKPVDVDGLIRQVTFKVDSQDKTPKGGAETYVSVNSEADPYVPRYSQRRVNRESVRDRTRISPRRRFPQPRGDA